MNEFFASLYELWGLAYISYENFSDQMYEYEVYTPIGWFLIVSAIVWMLIYYKVLDHVNFSRWYHWMLWLILLCVFNFGFAYYWSYTELNFHFQEANKELPYSGEFTNFSLVNVLYAVCLAMICTMIMKRFAVNTKKTPF